MGFDADRSTPGWPKGTIGAALRACNDFGIRRVKATFRIGHRDGIKLRPLGSESQKSFQGPMNRSFLRALLWICIAGLGAFSLATIALRRGESINALWLILAALCSYAVGYRFYSKFVSTKLLLLDSSR